MNARIEELQSDIAQARQDDAARRAKEQEPQDRIRKAEAEIARIRRHEAHDTWLTAVTESVRLHEENLSAVDALKERMADHDLKGSLEAMSAVNEAYERLRQHNLAALGQRRDPRNVKLLKWGISRINAVNAGIKEAGDPDDAWLRQVIGFAVYKQMITPSDKFDPIRETEMFALSQVTRGGW